MSMKPEMRHKQLNTGTSLSKTERQDAEINKLLDRLQEAHEERDRYKKALETIESSFYPSHNFMIAREALNG